MKNEKDFRELLTIKPKGSEGLKNRLKVWMKWDSNDADYIERTDIMNPQELFSNKKLIYCLAYITLPYNFKGHKWNDNVFRHHITNNTDIEYLEDILSENNFMVYSDWGACHSCYGLGIIYYDENETPFEITFDDIHKEFEKMTYEEICNKINSL